MTSIIMTKNKTRRSIRPGDTGAPVRGTGKAIPHAALRHGAKEQQTSHAKTRRISRKGEFRMAVTTANIADSPAAVARERYTTGFVTSKDGTTIGYRQFGHGP